MAKNNETAASVDVNFIYGTQEDAGEEALNLAQRAADKSGQERASIAINLRTGEELECSAWPRPGSGNSYGPTKKLRDNWPTFFGKGMSRYDLGRKHPTDA